MKNARSWLILAVTGLVLVMMAQAACVATPYYVSTTGSDNNSGLSTGQAWATIDKGDRSQILQPGDTVTVLPGTYNIDTVVLSKCAGTILHPITYQAQGTVVLDRGQLDEVGVSIEASYIVFDGFYVKGGNNQIEVSGTAGNEVKNCLCSDQFSAGCGILITQSTNTMVHNNVVNMSAASGHSNSGIYDTVSNGGDKICNNTIIGAADWGFLSTSGNAPVEFNNNIIYTGVTGGIYSDNTLFTHSNNIVYGSFTYAYGGYAGGQGTGNLEADPQFVNAAAGNYSLQTGSPAINSGLFVGLPYQGSAPDRGAFESTGSPVTNTGAVVGRVTEAGTDLILAGVVVKLLDSQNTVVAQATTDRNGYYSIAWKTGTWTVTASLKGYSDDSDTAGITANTRTEINFEFTPVPSQTYFVSPNGSDDNTGIDENHAWATIDYGDINNKLNPGDKVIVLQGTYDVSLGDPAGVFISKCSGTPARPIKYVAQGVVTIAHGTDYPFPALHITASYIVFDGFKVTGGRPTVWLDGTTSDEIKNCQFSGMTAEDNRACVYVTSGSNNIFHNNVITPAQPYNVTWGVSSEASAGGDKFYNNTIAGANGWAFLSRNGNVITEFKNNIIYSGTATGGIYSDNALFVHSNNIVYGTFGDTYGGYAGGQGSDNLQVDPLFVDAANGDYHLQATSPAIDSGVFVGLSYNGSAPDRGALESTGTPVNGVGYVVGRVINNGITLAGATVKLTDSQNTVLAQTITDKNGFYKIAWTAGSWTVKASLKGYSEASSSATITVDNSIEVNLALTVVAPKTYYVSLTGNNSNTGLSKSQAWAAIDNGDKNDLLGPGDTVIVLAGTYDVSNGGAFIGRCSGTSEAPIKYVAQGVVTITAGVNNYTYSAMHICSSHIVFDGFKVTGGRPVMWVDGTTGDEIKNCQFSGMIPENNRSCVYVTSGSNNIFHHNVVIPAQPNNATGGVNSESSIGGDKFYNNTIVGANDWGFMTRNGDVSVEFKNNIIYSGTATGGIYSANAQFVHSNNILYGNFTYPCGGYAEGQGSNISSADPQFVNAAGGDYRLQTGSTAIDAGVNVGLIYLGNAPDLGAFEIDPTAIDVSKISDIKSATKGQHVRLTSAMAVTVPSGAFADGSIYIEDPQRSSGIMVLGAAGLLEGDRVTLSGIVDANEYGEKYLQVTSIDSVNSGIASLGPLGTVNKSEQEALVTGLLVKIWGKVTSVSGSSYCYVDDGSNVNDGTNNVGVRVILDSLTTPLTDLPQFNNRIIVTGVVGIATDGSGVPVIRIRSGSDIAGY
ncbi:MAG: carboxypeptidase regulatory-like domain-containing protein [Armatimonadota bacterium]|nr:carboxypeptidase regulatory-like domain-containing protein [bacterium]